MTGRTINSIISSDRRFVRMGLAKPKDLTNSEVDLIAGLLDGWAEVAEMTDEVSGLTEFGKVGKMLLGDANWRRVIDNAHKYSDVEKNSDDHGRDQKVIDPNIATMSLQNSVDRLAKLGQCTSEEAAQQAQRLSRGDTAGVRLFVDSRSVVPVGSMTGGISPAQAEAAADFVSGKRGVPESQRMSLERDRDEYDAAADFVLND